MFKVCARCGQEYQSWATECSDCGVPLDLAPGETLAPESPAPARAIRPLEDRVVLQLGEPRDLQRLAESLQAQGISSQIDMDARGPAVSMGRRPRGQPAQLGLYVSRADLEEAREIAQELAAREQSDESERIEHEPDACPACGEPTPANASACSSCGLEFPEVPEEP